MNDAKFQEIPALKFKIRFCNFMYVSYSSDFSNSCLKNQTQRLLRFLRLSSNWKPQGIGNFQRPDWKPKYFY